jgi:integrase
VIQDAGWGGGQHGWQDLIRRTCAIAWLRRLKGACHRIDGITFIDITTEGGRRLKTESSRRRVPIHPELTALGFVEWARKKDGALFADMLPEKEEAQLSRLASRDLNRMIRAAGVKEARKAFHSFRHLFKDMCREAGVEEAIGDALTGHAGGGIGRRYGAGFSLAVLADAVGKLRWPVDLSHLLPASDSAPSTISAQPKVRRSATRAAMRLMKRAATRGG